MSSTIATLRKKLTPPQVAEMYGVSVDKILRWIASSELRAFNAATRAGGRPRWLIDPDDLKAFEERRAATPTPKPTRRAKKTGNDVIEFF